MSPTEIKRRADERLGGRYNPHADARLALKLVAELAALTDTPRRTPRDPPDLSAQYEVRNLL